VLIDQYRQRVDCFRRVDSKCWSLQGCGPGATVRFQSLDWEGSIDDLYEDVIFQFAQA
jgi:Uma2 family endonuclease